MKPKSRVQLLRENRELRKENAKLRRDKDMADIQDTMEGRALMDWRQKDAQRNGGVR